MNKLFSSLDLEQIKEASTEVFKKFSIADLFIENVEQKIITLRNGIFEGYNNFSTEGFTIRGVDQTKDILFVNNQVNQNNILKSIEELKNNAPENDAEITLNPLQNINKFYDSDYTISDLEIRHLMQDIEHYLLSNCEIIKDISITFSNKKQNVIIMNNLGSNLQDTRPAITIRISVVVIKGKAQNNFFESLASCVGLNHIKQNWQNTIDHFIESINMMIDAKDTISGVLPVLFDAGDPGTLIHEAVGHSLESDFNRQKTSVFTECIDSKIAADGVNIVDDGTIYNSFGSINFDDEGMPSQKNIIVENGMLKNYLFDRKNANLMSSQSTGNARRQNFKTPPIPRMTNTYLVASSPEKEASFEEMIDGHNEIVFVKGIGHGQVDITSGQFSFMATEAYLLKGKEKTPIKECIFSGMGSEVLMNISKIGRGFGLKQGRCGKRGSLVPVTCGQSQVLVDKITLG